MRPVAFTLLIAAIAGLAACNRPDNHVQSRAVRTLVVHLRPLQDERQAVGEVRPRYESDLSFRVAGKLLARSVDVGTAVKKGDTLAKLDTQDYENRLRAAEAEVASAEAALVEARASEARKAKLLSSGWTPKATYDTVVHNLRAAEAKLTAAKANLELSRDQLRYTELEAEFDGVIMAVGAEVGQNVAAGQMVVKLARPADKDGVFSVAESVFAKQGEEMPGVVTWLLSNPDIKIDGEVREISPVADAATRTYLVKVTLKNPPSQLRFGMSLAARVKSATPGVAQLPHSALFEKDSSPAVWVVNPTSGELALRPVTVARYETTSVIIEGGLSDGDIVVTAGINTLREGQRVQLAAAPSGGVQ